MCHGWWKERDWRAEGREVWKDFDREQRHDEPTFIADPEPREQRDADVRLDEERVAERA